MLESRRCTTLTEVRQTKAPTWNPGAVREHGGQVLDRETAVEQLADLGAA